MTQNEVRDNKQAARYELQTPQGVAFVAYHPEGDALVFTHTEVPEEAEGQGVGSRLVKAALDGAKAQGKQVVPECPFVASYIGEHAEYRGLVPEDQQKLLER